MVTRCSWAEHDELREYHDVEWGVPVHDERRLFELLTLEGAQSGLSWLIVLRRREGYRSAFADFDPAVVASYGPEAIDRLVLDPDIIRHRGKIESTISNASAVIALREAGTDLDDLLWSVVDGRPRQHDWTSSPEWQTSTPESEALSKELKRHGFRFVGPTTCHALMQAAGLVNDHHPTCFRAAEVARI